MIPTIDFPKAFKDLFTPARLKVYYGGRGGAKSESVARYLLIEGAREPMTILCAREFQNSIKDSVHELLSHLIEHHKLDSFYKVTQSEIRGENGTKFIFAGLRHNIANIKSMHDIKKCWVEEAETVSDTSWKILFPTIRSDGSEIIVTFNPDIADSPTYQRMVVNPPEFAIVKKVSYRDNPYFPSVLEQERKHMEISDPVAYDNVWEGNVKAAVEGAIFADEIRLAEEESRITTVPYDSTVPVNTYWDLGKSALTAIWWCQYVGMQWRVIDFYSNHMQQLSHYLEIVQKKPYVYGTHYLPHDAEHDRLGMENSIKWQADEALRNVQVVPRVSHKINSINAAKQIFSQCWFDEEKCIDGINDLRRYAYKINPETGKISNEPEEGTTYRDTADAFQCFAMAAIPDEYRKPKMKIRPQFRDPYEV